MTPSLGPCSFRLVVTSGSPSYHDVVSVLAVTVLAAGKRVPRLAEPSGQDFDGEHPGVGSPVKRGASKRPPKLDVWESDVKAGPWRSWHLLVPS